MQLYVFKVKNISFRVRLNPFSASQLSTANFSLYNTYKIWHLVMRKWELIKQSQLLKIKVKFSQICSMKSMGSGWENLKIQLALKGLMIAAVLSKLPQRFLRFTFSTWNCSSQFASQIFAKNRYSDFKICKHKCF